MLMNLAAYAKSVGKSKQYIHKLYQLGRLKEAIIVDEKTGKVQIVKKIADLIISKKFTQDIGAVDQEKENCDSDFPTISYDEARRLKLCYEGEFEKIKVDKEKGKLILAEDVKKDAYKTGLIFRDKMLSIPAQVAPILSGKVSIFDIKNTLIEYITNALNEIASKGLMETLDDENCA